MPLNPYKKPCVKYGLTYTFHSCKNVKAKMGSLGFFKYNFSPQILAKFGFCLSNLGKFPEFLNKILQILGSTLLTKDNSPLP